MNVESVQQELKSYIQLWKMRIVSYCLHITSYSIFIYFFILFYFIFYWGEGGGGGGVHAYQQKNRKRTNGFRGFVRIVWP